MGNHTRISSLRTVLFGWACRCMPWNATSAAAAHCLEASRMLPLLKWNTSYNWTWLHTALQVELLTLFTLFISILPFYEEKMCAHEMQSMFISQEVYSVWSQSTTVYWITLEYFYYYIKCALYFSCILGKVEKNLPNSYEIHLILQNSEDFR